MNARRRSELFAPESGTRVFIWKRKQDESDNNLVWRKSEPRLPAGNGSASKFDEGARNTANLEFRALWSKYRHNKIDIT